MKIGIVTVYNSSNYGAYWQAKAMESFLREYGHEPVFIITGARKPVRKLLYDFLLSVKKRQFNITSLLHNIKKEMKFRQFQQMFNTCRRGKASECELCIFGSDEIWNISKKAFAIYPVFWGKGIDNNVTKVSYAPSINRTTKEQVLKYSKGIKALSNFKYISVRDAYSQHVLEDILNRPIELVLDPTLLYKRDFYKKCEQPIAEREMSYIVVYSYGNGISVQAREAIRELADRESLKMISLGNRLSWCDASIICSPEMFLTYICKAKYCFTDTFHGTIFSLIYHKQVGIFANMKKVKEVLDLLQMKECIIKSIDEISLLPTRKYNYSEMEERLDYLRKTSVDYLMKCLN